MALDLEFLVMKFAPAVVLALLASPVAAAEPGYVGRWAIEAASCTDQDTDAMPIAITARKIEFYASSCTIGSVTGFNPWTVTATCSGEGEISTRRWRYARTGDRLLVEDLKAGGRHTQDVYGLCSG